MKTKQIKFVHKGKEYAYNLATFESIKEATSLLDKELLNVINLGNAVYAKAMAMGKNPFALKKTKYKLDATKLDDSTLQKLKEMGAIV